MVLSVLLLLCKERPYGPAPLGWRGLFSTVRWAQLFRRPRRREFTSLSVEGVTKKYDDLVAVREVSFELGASECVICIGANGAGKSTLLGMLSGAILPTSGRLCVGGKEVGSRESGAMGMKEYQANVSVVFQENALVPLLTAREHIELLTEMNGGESAVEHYSGALKMGDFLDTAAGDLSGGSKRKLCLAMGLVKKPALLVLDEPTAGVDVEARQMLWRAVGELENLASFINVHSVEEAEAVASRLLVLKKGEVAFMGTPVELRHEFECGYELTLLDGAEGVKETLSVVQGVIPEAKRHKEHECGICLPADLRVADALDALGERRYQLQLDSLEMTITKLIEDEEAECGVRAG
jgi:ABC-type multidrug transport system ATPase subunit